jgi:hypothetical protein
MKQVYKYDSLGNYVEPVLIEDNASIPKNCTALPLPQPNFKPVFKNGAWVETGTPSPAPAPKPSVEDTLVQMEKDVADLWYAAMMGGLA